MVPGVATLSRGVQGDESPPQTGVEQAVKMRQFVHGAVEVAEQGDDRTTTITTSSTPISNVSVNALGFLRYIVLEIEATGGVESGSGVVAAGDAPWNCITDIKLSDTNGRSLFGPLSGYQLYLVNKWCGLGVNQGLYDPASLQSFTDIAADDPNFAFKLRIPVEITSRDGWGSLANQNDASTYKLSYTVVPSTTLYTTSPDTTLPNLRVRASSEAWSQPRALGPDGVPQATVPPMLGTTQYFSFGSVNVNSGAQRIKFDRMGNLIRNLLLIFYNDADPSVRISSEFPVDWRLEWDNKIVDTIRRNVFLDRMHERYGQAPDTGVFVYDFIHDADGRPGNENRHGYIPTVQGTRFHLVGNFTGAGTLQVITNDIAPSTRQRGDIPMVSAA